MEGREAGGRQGEIRGAGEKSREPGVFEAGEEEPNVRARCPLWCGEGDGALNTHTHRHTHVPKCSAALPGL